MVRRTVRISGRSVPLDSRSYDCRYIDARYIRRRLPLVKQARQGRLIEQRIRPQRQELGEVVRQDEAIEQLSGIGQAPLATLAQAGQLLVADRGVERRI